MKENNKKVSYTAPKMEAASFNVEQGYAVSGSAKGFGLNVGSGGL